MYMTDIYYASVNVTDRTKQLNSRVIARITSGKTITNIEYYTALQVLSIQRLANKVNKVKIAYRNGV